MAEFMRRFDRFEAEQFLPEKRPWPAGVRQIKGSEAPEFWGKREDEIVYVLDTDDGPYLIEPGSWITRRQDPWSRERYSDSEFRRSFEAVPSERIATLEAQLAEANVELEASRRLLSKHEELRVQADKMAEQRDEMTKQRDSVLTAAYEAFRYLKGRPGTYRADVIAEMLEADLRRAKWM